MNVFYLSKNADACARYHCDKHVVKMILEYAQLLSTAHRVLDGEQVVVVKNGRRCRTYVLRGHLHEATLYKATHVNHPSARWVRESTANYTWLWHLFCAVCDEYTHRYGKIHKTESKLRMILTAPPVNIPRGKFTPPPLAMPDKYMVEGDALASYRAYYIGDKQRMARWKKRNPPKWFVLEEP